MNSKSNVYLAVDLGASSGRVMAGSLSVDTGHLILEEVDRFETSTIEIDGTLRWNILDIFNSIKGGFKLAAERYGDRVQSVGVDSWAVDYGLIDEAGDLVGEPYHYRDSRTKGMREAVLERVSNDTLYAETGIQYLFFNTIYQLYSEVRIYPESVQRARHLLFIPDLIGYWLTGTIYQERTVASTSQLLNPSTGAWSEKLLSSLNLPSDLFKPVIEPGTRVGELMPELRQETGLDAASVVAVAGHDTASAFVALPGARRDFAVMSSGTWSLMGLELDEPRLDSDALRDGFSNEIGFGGTIRFLKNICGMWLVEQCLSNWIELGRVYDYETVAEMAENATSFVSLIDPDAPEFAAPHNMPEAIGAFCERTNQPIPADDGAMLRCIFDSLALKYRHVFRKLSGFAPQPLQGIYVLGGGARNRFLNQLTADALGVPVATGPAEATAAGNVAVQMIADGTLGGLDEARELVAKTFESERFEPSHTERFDSFANRFEGLSLETND